MSDIRFTSQQLKVIETHNRNLLISAAAGSGKTAVLVERIIRLTTRKENPIPIDQLLVVTFTNAAAAEMRERVGNALYNEIEKDPSNHYLQQQLTLLPSASMMTLHAFCLTVIKNYFYILDLDPSFKIGDETELTLIRQEVLEVVLEQLYEENTEDFIELIEAYAPGKTDKAIEALILDVYRLSQSHPTPSKWLEQSVSMLEFTTMDEWFGSKYVGFMVSEIIGKIEALKVFLKEGIALIEADDRLKPMVITLQEYDDFMDDILEVKDEYASLFERLHNKVFQRAKSAKRGTESEVVDPVKHILTRIKESLKELQKNYGRLYDEAFLARMAVSKNHMTTLVKVIKRFDEVYQINKSEEYLLDFNDIEHFALKILLDEQGGLSEVAKVYQELYTEVLVDEYQDSNLVQEALIRSVSREEKGQPNIFMVGDIKQSIYKFRLAKPELFAGKYDTYTTEDSLYQKIELHENFRSRREVIELINYVFKQLMSKQVGDVTYDNSAALHQGARYTVESDNYKTDVILVEREGFEFLTTQQIEAKAVACEIQSLMTIDPPMVIYDKQEGIERQLCYKDIVILLRTMSGWSETFVETLSDYGIPVASRTATGYFDTIEIQTVMNILRILDNPKQDIPLLAVLRSPIFKFTGDELVTVRLAAEQVDYHTALMVFYESILDESKLSEKVIRFVTKLKEWRSLKNQMSIYDVVKKVFDDTDYYNYISLMIGGPQRQANLDMFLDQVYKYEQTSYKGLFNFIRYMEHIKKHSIDFGEAQMGEEQSNQVTIMSIHGSKGLEFPVVIVAGLNKLFNKRDLRQAVLLHQDYGFGTDTVDVGKHIKVASPIKEVLKSKMDQELKSEELRVLYVALTRAREKLILLGSIKGVEEQINKWCQILSIKACHLGDLRVKEAKSYLDWIMMALMRHSETIDIYKNTGYDFESILELQDIEPAIKIHIKNNEDYELGQGPVKATKLGEVEESSITLDELNQHMSWSYAHKELTKLHVSQSVSELKRLENEGAVYIGPQDGVKPSYRPVFITGEQALTGAEKGTIYHKIMYHVDFTKEMTVSYVADLVNRLIEKRVITSKEAESIYTKGIYEFTQLPLGQRIREAAAKDLLYKEKPFVMGIPLSEVTKDDTKDYIMIQGVIDLYFEEDDGIVLVDYKTDYMKEKPLSELVNRYRSQMRYYKRALEQSTGKPVKEVYLYAVGLREAVEVTMESEIE